MVISIIMPALNEQAVLASSLAALAHRSANCELIVVDGGSSDQTRTMAKNAGAKVLETQRGRARQMNYGASHAKGSILVFVHADTCLPADFAAQIPDLLDAQTDSACWGRFDIALDCRRWWCRCGRGADVRRGCWCRWRSE